MSQHTYIQTDKQTCILTAHFSTARPKTSTITPQYHVQPLWENKESFGSFFIGGGLSEEWKNITPLRAEWFLELFLGHEIRVDVHVCIYGENGWHVGQEQRALLWPFPAPDAWGWRAQRAGGVTPVMVCDTHVWSHTCSLSCLLTAFCLVLSSVFTWEFSCYLRVKEKAWNWKKERLIMGKCRNRLKTWCLRKYVLTHHSQVWNRRRQFYTVRGPCQPFTALTWEWESVGRPTWPLGAGWCFHWQGLLIRPFLSQTWLSGLASPSPFSPKFSRCCGFYNHGVFIFSRHLPQEYDWISINQVKCVFLREDTVSLRD